MGCLAANASEQIHGFRTARVFQMVKAFPQKFVPILSFGYMMNHRPKNHVVVRIPAVFEEQNFSARLQDSNGFIEQLLPRTTRRQLMRAKAEAPRRTRRQVAERGNALPGRSEF